MNQKTLQWHPAFLAALQIELSEESAQLQFISEFNLSEKPLRIDVLVIKADSEVKLSKSIGRIFRKYNIVEYKSPDDYFSINDFYKITAYACIYQSNTEREGQIPPEELTITIAVSHYPGKLIRFLKRLYHAICYENQPGIYYVTGLMFPLQILVIPRLPKEDFTWLGRLRTDLTLREDIEPLAKAYAGKEQNPLYEAVMDLIVRANWNKYKEGREMCNALEELFADKMKEKELFGIEQGIRAFILDNIEEGIPKSRILEKLKKRFSLSETTAEDYYCRFHEE